MRSLPSGPSVALWLALLAMAPGSRALAVQAPPRPGPPAEAVPATAPPAARAAGAGEGEYADSFVPLSTEARQYERDPLNRYTYCIRNTATYECLSYGSDGEVRRQRTRAVAHGTGFAYRRQDGETYLLTNQHVAAWPTVTDTRSKVEDVPAGCKLIGESLKIVDNEEDDYEADDVPLSRVVDQAAPGSAGTVSRLWFGNERGLKEYEPGTLDSESLAQVQAVLRRLYGLGNDTLRYRELTERASASRQGLEDRAAVQRALGREGIRDADLAQGLLDVAERLAPRPTDPPLSYASVLARLTPAPAMTAKLADPASLPTESRGPVAAAP